MLTENTKKKIIEFYEDCIKEADKIDVDRNSYLKVVAKMFDLFVDMTDCTNYVIEN